MEMRTDELKGRTGGQASAIHIEILGINQLRRGGRSGNGGELFTTAEPASRPRRSKAALQSDRRRPGRVFVQPCC